MAYSNKTAHYELPQYDNNDVPSILTDVNEAYEKIDEVMYDTAETVEQIDGRVTTLETNVETLTEEVAQARTDANLAKTTADTALEKAKGIDDLSDRVDEVESKADEALDKATNAEEKANNAEEKAEQGSTDIGNLDDLDTENKNSIVDAINELLSKMGITIDTVMSDTSENAVQNKVIKAYVDEVKTKANSNETKIGNLSLLNTSNKSNLVGALNEVLSSGGGSVTRITDGIEFHDNNGWHNAKTYGVSIEFVKSGSVIGLFSSSEFQLSRDVLNDEICIRVPNNGLLPVTNDYTFFGATMLKGGAYYINIYYKVSSDYIRFKADTDFQCDSLTIINLFGNAVQLVTENYANQMQTLSETVALQKSQIAKLAMVNSSALAKADFQSMTADVTTDVIEKGTVTKL